MNWQKPRETIILSISPIKQNDSQSFTWMNLRKNTLEKIKYTCRYCGGFYKKYLICLNLDDSKQKTFKLENTDMCCKACFIINHLNYGFNDDVVLCFSKLPQLDIVRSTVDYVIKNTSIPSPDQIDHNARRAKLTTLELSNLLLNKKGPEIEEKLKDLKIFFTKNLDISFITKNYYNNSNKYMFIEDKFIEDKFNEGNSDDSNELNNKEINKAINKETKLINRDHLNIPLQEFSEEQNKFLRDSFFWHSMQ